MNSLIRSNNKVEIAATLLVSIHSTARHIRDHSCHFSLQIEC